MLSSDLFSFDSGFELIVDCSRGVSLEFFVNKPIGLLIEPYVLLKWEDNKKMDRNCLKRRGLVMEWRIMEGFFKFIKFTC